MAKNDKSGDQTGDDKNKPQTQTKQKNDEKGNQAPVVSMSQDQIDEIIKGRVDRAKEQTLSSLAKKYGYDSVDQMVELAKSAKEKVESEKSELQKVTEEKTKLEREKLDAELEVADALTKAEFKVLAAQKGVIDPDSAWLIAKGLNIVTATVQLETKTVMGIEENVDALIKAKPFLVKAEGTPKPQSQQSPTNPPKPGSGETKDSTDQFLDIIKGVSKTPE